MVAALISGGVMSVANETWPRPHRLTVDDYYRMAEVGVLRPDQRVELIEGEIIDMPPIGSLHGAVVDLLAERFITVLKGAALVRIQGAVRLGNDSEPQPDVALLRSRADRYAANQPRAEDVLLVIEVSDTTLKFDTGTKARLYARHGVPELWVVDLENRQLQRFRAPRLREYSERTVHAAGVFEIPSLGTTVDLGGLFL
jgi:Uma2 family endonuclease